MILELVAASNKGGEMLAPGTFAHTKYYEFDITEVPIAFEAYILNPYILESIRLATS